MFYFLITHVVDLHESCQLSDNIYGKDSVHETLDAHLPRLQIILPAASARSRLSPLMTKKKCRSWTKPSTSLDSSGAYNWSVKCKRNNFQICRDEKIDVYRVTSCCMVLSQLEFQVQRGKSCKQSCKRTRAWVRLLLPSHWMVARKSTRSSISATAPKASTTLSSTPNTR